MNDVGKQLSIFDMFDDEKQHSLSTFYEVNDRVQIKHIRESEEMEPEDYYYLKKYSGKQGDIIAKGLNSKGISYYKVKFNNGLEGYFYERDFT